MKYVYFKEDWTLICEWDEIMSQEEDGFCDNVYEEIFINRVDAIRKLRTLYNEGNYGEKDRFNRHWQGSVPINRYM